MNTKNVLCCINDTPLFSYQDLNHQISEQTIINFLTSSSSKKWIHRESAMGDDICFIYYEVNIEKAYEAINKNRHYQKNTIESFCFTFLKLFLEDNSKKLLDFLKETNNFSDEELKEFEQEFKRVK